MVQTVILLTGALAIWLTQVGSLKASRAACLIGLAGQPCWLYATTHAGQWGMFLLSVFYTLAWLMGVCTYWFKGGAHGK